MNTSSIKSLHELKEFFAGDRFVAYNGITIDECTEQFAKVSVIITNNHLNAGNTVQGGLIFTLSDFAFAVHANRTGVITVSQNCSITYMSAPKGKRLEAIAVPIKEGRTTVTYKVDVVDELGTKVAFCVVNGFVKG